MHDWSSLSHVRWECKYHVVIVPKYRKKVLYGGMRKQVGELLRERCRQKGVELLEGHLLSDHIHNVASGFHPPPYGGPPEATRSAGGDFTCARHL